MMRCFLLVLCLMAVGLCPLVQSSSSFVSSSRGVSVFSAGEGGYMCIRIPVLVAPVPGVLLAFAEARSLHSKNYNCCVSPVQDYPWCTDKEIVIKRSDDGGRTWGALTKFAEANSTFFYSNPDPIYVPDTQELVMLYSRCSTPRMYQACSLWMTRSPDWGKTWASSIPVLPNNISSGLSGPPGGLRLTQGPHKGRLLWPVASTHQYSIYSDDEGRSVRLGVAVPDAEGESQITQQTPSGTVYQSIRLGFGGKHVFTQSNDGGVSWNDPTASPQLPNSNCQASFLFSASHSGFLFSTVASSVDGNRANMTIYTSKDTKTWTEYALVYNGPSGYSSMASVNNSATAILYEAGVKSPYELVTFQYV